jgi:hypothetical protein
MVLIHQSFIPLALLIATILVAGFFAYMDGSLGGVWSSLLGPGGESMDCSEPLAERA